VTFNVHTGGDSGGGGACHAMSMLTGCPGPFALLATSVYVCVPALDDAAVQLDVVLEHPVHANDVGPPLQVAFIVIDEPATGKPLLATSEHTGRADGSRTGEHIATGMGGGP
jgi:hypothetical protein